METLQLETPKKKLQLEPLTEAQIREMGRDYNPAIWDRTIDRFNACKDVEFYTAPKDDCYSYDRYFAVYTTDEGIRFFNSVSYSVSITSRGFLQVYIPTLTISPEFEAYGVYTTDFQDAKGNRGRLDTTDANRRYMAEMSSKFGDVFTSIL
jgi:hypothetical protein